jgi:sialate O-acetylesterase
MPMRSVFTCLLLLCCSCTYAQLKLARIFGDHMVLQRGKSLPVWGWAAKNEKIRLQFHGKTYGVKADKEGRWQVTMDPVPAGGPYVLHIQGQKEKLDIADILIGEVWICSGQSNMEWPLVQTENAAAEIRAAEYPNIRQFAINHDVSFKPLSDFKDGKWESCSPQTAPHFTAVGYYFAKEIHQKTGVPVGLIHSSWGGSQLESWLSQEGIEGASFLSNYTMPKSWEEADAHLLQLIEKRILPVGQPRPDASKEKEYLKPGYDVSPWFNGRAPDAWDWQGIWAFRGTGYMAKTFVLDSLQAAAEARLSIGINNSPYQLYVNGQLVEEATRSQVRTVVLPKGILYSGKNTLIIRQGAHNHNAMGIQGNKEDLYLQLGGEKISLAGEGWKLMPSFTAPYTFGHWMNNAACLLYNAMIHPLVPYALQGVLWYQGESNASRAYQYRQSFPLLIEDWRKKWKDDFSFYFVQLSSYGKNQDSNEGSNWAELREAQAMTLSLPKTAMAITLDIGNALDIHPRNKKDVGLRLAAQALSKVYGKIQVCEGPLYESMGLEGEKVVLHFGQIGSGLVARDRYGYLKAFEIAGEDKLFYPAKALVRGNEVVVWHEQVSKPVAVRYGWSDAPTDANLYNKEGFPAAPFRTDKWPAKTEKVRFE